MEDILFTGDSAKKRRKDQSRLDYAWEVIKPTLALPAPKLLSLRDWVSVDLSLLQTHRVKDTRP